MTGWVWIILERLINNSCWLMEDGNFIFNLHSGLRRNKSRLEEQLVSLDNSIYNSFLLEQNKIAVKHTYHLIKLNYIQNKIKSIHFLSINL